MSLEDYKDRLLTREEYYLYLKEIEVSFPADYCSFCQDQGALMLKEFKYWKLIFCKAPYWKYHLMLVPKRHFKEFTQMNKEEQEEFNKAIKYTLGVLRSAKLKYDDGKLVDVFLFFWRVRDQNRDPIALVRKTDHFHFHIVPEKEHSWESILDPNARDIDVGFLKDLFCSTSFL